MCSLQLMQNRYMCVITKTRPSYIVFFVDAIKGLFLTPHISKAEMKVNMSVT